MEDLYKSSLMVNQVNIKNEIPNRVLSVALLFIMTKSFWYFFVKSLILFFVVLNLMISGSELTLNKTVTHYSLKICQVMIINF